MPLSIWDLDNLSPYKVKCVLIFKKLGQVNTYIEDKFFLKNQIIYKNIIISLNPALLNG